MIFDTDVLIWFFRGNRAAVEVVATSRNRAVSIVTFMELFQAAKSSAELGVMRRFFASSEFRIIPISEPVSHLAATLMEEFTLRAGLQLADALIAATVREHAEVLVTGAIRHFRAIPQLQSKAFRPNVR